MAGRHLGLDLGGTNIKWAVVEHGADGAWRQVEHGQVPTDAGAGPSAVVEHVAQVGAQALEKHPDVSTVGVGVPGLYDPATGATRMLPNLPGEWSGVPMGQRVARARR